MKIYLYTDDKYHFEYMYIYMQIKIKIMNIAQKYSCFIRRSSSVIDERIITDYCNDVR